jgi:hypothetical protein
MSSKKSEYTQNVLDGVQLIEFYATSISGKVPKENQFDALVQAIAYVHISVLEQHNMAVQYDLCVNWSPEEFVKSLKKKPAKEEA